MIINSVPLIAGYWYDSELMSYLKQSLVVGEEKQFEAFHKVPAVAGAQLLSSQIHHEISYYIWQECAHEQPPAQLKGQNKHWPS